MTGERIDRKVCVKHFEWEPCLKCQKENEERAYRLAHPIKFVPKQPKEKEGLVWEVHVPERWEIPIAIRMKILDLGSKEYVRWLIKEDLERVRLLS
jgi:hypothetical protein